MDIYKKYFKKFLKEHFNRQFTSRTLKGFLKALWKHQVCHFLAVFLYWGSNSGTIFYLQKNRYLLLRVISMGDKDFVILTILPDSTLVGVTYT